MRRRGSGGPSRRMLHAAVCLMARVWLPHVNTAMLAHACPLAQAMLKEGHKHLSGLEEAVLKNIQACKELAQITRTSMGPNGARLCCGAAGRTGGSLLATICRRPLHMPAGPCRGQHAVLPWRMRHAWAAVPPPAAATDACPHPHPPCAQA